MKWNTNMHRCATRRQKVISGTASEHLHSGWLSSPKQRWLAAVGRLSVSRRQQTRGNTQLTMRRHRIKLFFSSCPEVMGAQGLQTSWGARMGPNQALCVWVTSCVAWSISGAPVCKTRIYPLCLSWLFGTHFLWRMPCSTLMQDGGAWSCSSLRCHDLLTSHERKALPFLRNGWRMGGGLAGCR